MIIMPHPYGRMCNRLLVAANFIAHAEEYGDSFLYLGFGRYFRFFESTRHAPFLYFRSTRPRKDRGRRLFATLNIWNTVDKNEGYFDMNQPAFLDLERATRFLFLIGWSFRNGEMLERHRDVVRQRFVLAPRHRDAVSRVIGAARQGADHLVGIHIRQTDYKNYLNGKYYYPPEAYRRIMRDIQAQLSGHTRFLVCSDSPVDRAFFSGLDIVTSSGHPVEDNYALAACDWIAGPPSSYSAWASFIGGTPLFFIEAAPPADSDGGAPAAPLSAFKARTRL